MPNGINPYSGQMLGLGNVGRLSQVMQDQALSPIQNAGVPGSELSITQVLSKLMQAYAGNKLNEEHAAKTGELAQRMQGDTNQGMNALYAGLSGQDPKAAIFEAMTHPSEAVRSMAKEQAKGMLTPRDLAKSATNESVLASGGNPTMFQPKKSFTTLTPGAVTIDASGKGVNVEFAEGAAPKTINIGGDLYQQTSTGLKKLDNAPKVTNTTTVNNMPGQLGESEFEKSFGKQQGTALGKFIEARPVHISAIDAANDGLNLLEKGIHSGALGNLAKGLDKGSIAIFKTDPAKASRTEQFLASSATQVLSALQQLGGNDSNEDRKYLMGVMGGDITAEPETLKAIMKRTIERSRRELGTGDKAIENYRARGKTIPTMDEGTLPQPKEDFQPTKATNDLDSFLKSKGF